MAALGQVHAHDGIAQVQQRKVDGQVACAPESGAARVGVLAPNSLQARSMAIRLHLIHKLAATVVAVALG